MKINSRIHACLDGDLCRSDLSAAEREELAELERDLAPAVRYAGSVPAVDLRASVMQRLPEALAPLPWHERARTSMRRGWSAFWAPRRVSFEVRPSFALAMVLALALVPAGIFRGIGADAPSAAADEDTRPILVQFRLDAPEASTVSLAGSFSGWDAAIELWQSAPGVWTATVPLRPGVHDYLFLVDSVEWVTDPLIRPVEDDFGGMNSRLLLTTPATTL
jgi:hypothetical protein